MTPATGPYSALAAAFLFGASTPLAKELLGQLSPWLLAGLLYLGSGVGLTAIRLFRDRRLEHTRAGVGGQCCRRRRRLCWPWRWAWRAVTCIYPSATTTFTPTSP